MKRIPREDIMIDAVIEAEHHDFVDHKIFLAKDNKKTVGWGILFKEKNRKLPKFMVWTCPKHRRKGIGTRIFEEAAKFTKKMAIYAYDESSISYYKCMSKQFKVKLRNVNNF